MPKVERRGGPGFRYLGVDLAPGESIVTESGAMASMDADVALSTEMRGGLIGALIRKFLGGESLFINTFKNKSSSNRRIELTQSTPGELIEHELQNESLFVQGGAFVAKTEGISMSVRWAGIASWLAGEGLFRLCLSGTGRVWYGAFGAVIEREVKGALIVDSGHLLSYPPSIKLKGKLVGGLLTSFFSGEGIVLRLEGEGKVRLQTRSLGGLAGWINPKFWS